MEQIKLDQDITVFYVDATSFPEGVLDAFERLHAYFPFNASRRFFGLSRMENNREIVYKAAVEILDSAGAVDHPLKTMTIPKGNYIAETVHQFKDKIPQIGETFMKLLAHPSLDPQGYCVEEYLPNDQDVVCMVRILH